MLYVLYIMCNIHILCIAYIVYFTCGEAIVNAKKPCTVGPFSRSILVQDFLQLAAPISIFKFNIWIIKCIFFILRNLAEINTFRRAFQQDWYLPVQFENRSKVRGRSLLKPDTSRSVQICSLTIFYRKYKVSIQIQIQRSMKPDTRRTQICAASLVHSRAGAFLHNLEIDKKSRTRLPSRIVNAICRVIENIAD